MATMSPIQRRLHNLRTAQQARAGKPLSVASTAPKVEPVDAVHAQLATAIATIAQLTKQRDELRDERNQFELEVSDLRYQLEKAKDLEKAADEQVEKLETEKEELEKRLDTERVAIGLHYYLREAGKVDEASDVPWHCAPTMYQHELLTAVDAVLS